MTNTADAHPRPFSPAEVAFLVGVPLLWGILPVGLTLFIGAVLLVVRDRSAVSAPAPVGTPGLA